MRGERKRVSRAEAQQHTREEVLDAAEELFLDKGFHDTSVAKIAAAAGRTQGAIYANFTSKEHLCFEVLQRRYLQTFTQLVQKIAESGVPFDDQVKSFAEWWKALAGNVQLTTLATEYALLAHKDPEQQQAFGGYLTTARGVLAMALSGTLPIGASQQRRDEAILGLLATGSGLALGQAAGILDEQRVSDLLVQTLQLWAGQLGREAGTAD